jgi:uncharacterized membrane protein YhaH (DUF805 family)
MTSFGEAISLFYRNYVNFEGRSSRAEYWWPFLMQAIVYTTLFIAFILLVGFEAYEESGGGESAALALLLAGGLFALVNFLPGIAVKVRRFHDLDQTGWLVLVFAIANAIISVTWIAQMIWYAMPGTNGPNQYGPDPYHDNADIFG